MFYRRNEGGGWRVKKLLTFWKMRDRSNFLENRKTFWKMQTDFLTFWKMRDRSNFLENRKTFWKMQTDFLTF